MRSHLTRGVIRRLLSNEGYRFRCVSQPSALARIRHGSNSIAIHQRRTFLNVFRGNGVFKSESRELMPGWETLQELRLKEDLRARLPEVKRVAEAIRSFTHYKEDLSQKVTDTQAVMLLQALRYVLAEDKESLSMRDLKRARDVMIRPPPGKADAHASFAREIFEEIKARTLAQQENTSLDRHVKELVTALAWAGCALEARNVLESFLNTHTTDSRSSERVKAERKMWLAVLGGLAKEGKEAELLSTASAAEVAGLPYSPQFQEVMVSYFAAKDDFPSIKDWFERELSQHQTGARPTTTTLEKMMQSCLRTNQREYFDQEFKRLLSSNPTKEEWDLIFLLAVEGMGKGVEDLEIMMEAMVRRNPDDPLMRPDSTTINKLVELAISENNIFMAERYTSLGSKLGIRPDARSFLLQMNYRIDANDLVGAQAAYDALRHHGLEDNDDVPVINKYIRALCNAKAPNERRISELQRDLTESGGQIEPETVAALLILLIERDAEVKAMTEVSSHAYHHTADERARTRDTLLEYCLRDDIDVLFSWLAYDVINTTFPETDRETRMKVMDHFFSRDTPKLALSVFRDSLKMARPEAQPRPEEYVRCLKGIVKTEYGLGLKTIYTVLKMDSTVERTTRLNNALMLAFLTMGDHLRAVNIWQEIQNSAEGPDYTSLILIFRVYEMADGGRDSAVEVWEKMLNMQIDIPYEVTAAYCYALAKHHAVDRLRRLWATIQKDHGYSIDANTLATVSNLMEPNPHKLEEFAPQMFPEAWKEMQTFNRVRADYWDVYDVADRSIDV